MIEFLRVLPINLGMNKWKSENDKCKWNWNKPPKEGDGSWHIKMTLYDPDGEKFEKSYLTKHTDGSYNLSSILKMSSMRNSLT